MSEPKLTPEDWEEIVNALDLKAEDVEKGKYDDVSGEVDRPGSETARWAAHLRSIMAKIEVGAKHPAVSL